MKIDSYGFGKIVIDGKEYTDDVVITPAGVNGGWWRAGGHDITLFDLASALTDEIKKLIIGTGTAGACRVLPEVAHYCQTQGIELVAHPTPEAVVEYNEEKDKSTVVAALHLTC